MLSLLQETHISDETVYDSLYRYNAKFLTDEEVDTYINDSNVNIHVDIITDDEGVVAVE